LWAIRSERATWALARPRLDLPLNVVLLTLSANWSGAQWFARPVPCRMASIADHGDTSENPRGYIMKKTAFRIMALGGGLVATLLAGGAWVRG